MVRGHSLAEVLSDLAGVWGFAFLFIALAVIGLGNSGKAKPRRPGVSGFRMPEPQPCGWTHRGASQREAGEKTSKSARFPRADFVKKKEKPKMTAYPIPAR